MATETSSFGGIALLKKTPSAAGENLFGALSTVKGDGR